MGCLKKNGRTMTSVLNKRQWLLKKRTMRIKKKKKPTVFLIKDKNKI